MSVHIPGTANSRTDLRLPAREPVPPEWRRSPTGLAHAFTPAIPGRTLLRLTACGSLLPPGIRAQLGRDELCKRCEKSVAVSARAERRGGAR